MKHVLTRFLFCMACLLVFTGAGTNSAPDEQKKLPIASSGEIESFRIPERDSQGDLLWLIEGEKAKIIEEGRIRIFKVHLETYHKGVVDQTLQSSECMLIRQTENGKVTTHAESTHSVEIVGKNIIITADGFQWFPDQARLVLQKNVQVIFERKTDSFFKTQKSS